MSNKKHLLLDVIVHQCPEFNGGFAKHIFASSYGQCILLMRTTNIYGWMLTFKVAIEGNAWINSYIPYKYV